MREPLEATADETFRALDALPHYVKDGPERLQVRAVRIHYLELTAAAHRYDLRPSGDQAGASLCPGAVVRRS